MGFICNTRGDDTQQLVVDEDELQTISFKFFGKCGMCCCSARRGAFSFAVAVTVWWILSTIGYTMYMVNHFGEADAFEGLYGGSTKEVHRLVRRFATLAILTALTLL